jgi:hypothetical protein
VPSSSTQLLEPVKGCDSRFKWVFHTPISKSKSCCPSRLAAARDVAAMLGVAAVLDAAVDACCAAAGRGKERPRTQAAKTDLRNLELFMAAACSMPWSFKRAGILAIRSSHALEFKRSEGPHSARTQGAISSTAGK